MKELYLEKVEKAVKGEIVSGNKDIIIKDICTDTRKVKEGDLFIPLVGDNFDGHNFIEEAFSKGAVAVLSHKDISGKAVIKVEDTKEALADLAEYYISLFKIPIVAVTGSTGKTTTKELIYSVLSQKYKTIKTEGNFNNEIGLPLTAFRINESTQAVVFEMGMNHFNEIHKLSKIAKPDICVISNVGVSHIENLGSRDGILKAKSEIFDFMKENGAKIINGDDDKLITINNAVTFGINNKNADYTADILDESLNGINARLNYKNNEIMVNIPLPGRHMVLNALAALAVGKTLDISDECIKEGIENFKSAKMRMDIIETDRYIILNDVYNANPESVKAGINVMKNAIGRKVVVLGDMLELGKFADELHYETGKFAVKSGIDVVICIGELSQSTYNGAKEKNENVFYFKTQEDFWKEINGILHIGDTILVKASRGMHFEKTVEKIME